VNQVFVSLIILLVPGIVATLILDATMQHEKWDNFIFSVYVIIFGFFSYFSLLIIEQIFLANPWIDYHFKIFAFFTNLEGVKLERSSYWEIGLACIIAGLLSLLASYAVNHKWLTRFANKYGISNKYGDESLFYYYLNDWNNPENKHNTKWLSIRDSCRSKIYTGGLDSYSEQNGNQEIVLVNVDVYLADGTAYHLANLYICGKVGDFSIEPLTLEPKGKGNG